MLKLNKTTVDLALSSVQRQIILLLLYCGKEIQDNFWIKAF